MLCIGFEFATASSFPLGMYWHHRPGRLRWLQSQEFALQTPTSRAAGS